MSANDLMSETLNFGLRMLDHRGRPHPEEVVDVDEDVDDHGHEHGDDHGHDHGDGNHDEENDLAISIDAFKLLMALCMLLCVGGGITPRIWKRCRDSEIALSYMNCFSAGLFLGMALVHILPEAVEIYRAWAIYEEKEDPFPLPYVLFYVGYLLILLVDRVAA